MPELPEVETTKSSLSPLVGQTVMNLTVYQPKLRWQMPSDLPDLIGYLLTHVERRAKYLILHFTRDDSSLVAPTKKLIIHLGMSGSLQQLANGFEKRKHDHLIVKFMDSEGETFTQLHYHDPRRFGAVLWHDDYARKLLQHLGVEPLDDMFDGQYLYNIIHRLSHADRMQRTSKRRSIERAIKAVIMEQSIVVGVGNIYATESLFLANIHPNTPANHLCVEKLDILVSYIKQVLKTAIDKGGTTLKDFTVASGTTGYFQQTLNVYGKHNLPCPVCGTSIEKMVIAGRASTFCPNCQPKEL